MQWPQHSGCTCQRLMRKRALYPIPRLHETARKRSHTCLRPRNTCAVEPGECQASADQKADMPALAARKPGSTSVPSIPTASSSV